MGDADKQRAYRDRKRGGPARPPAPHGTRAAIRRHERAKEPLCAECVVERARINRANYEKRRPSPAE